MWLNNANIIFRRSYDLNYIITCNAHHNNKINCYLYHRKCAVFPTFLFSLLRILPKRARFWENFVSYQKHKLYAVLEWFPCVIVFSTAVWFKYWEKRCPWVFLHAFACSYLLSHRRCLMLYNLPLCPCTRMCSFGGLWSDDFRKYN